MSDCRRFILVDVVTRAQIYADAYSEEEAHKVAERLAPGYRYELVQVADAKEEADA